MVGMENPGRTTRIESSTMRLIRRSWRWLGSVAARNDLDYSGNRPTAAHGKLEKSEQQAILGRQARYERSETKKEQEVKSYGLTPFKAIYSVPSE